MNSSVAPRLIYCAGGNPSFARAAVDAGWEYGVRLPDTVYFPLDFADVNWKKPDRETYMTALAKYRPKMAVVLDWEHPDQLPEVLTWAEDAAALVSEAVVIVPKVPGQVDLLPRQVGGRRVVLGYSVPTSYGAAPLGLWELAGRPVHLLGGSPQRQRECWHYLAAIASVISLDGNMAAQQARRGRFWSPEPHRKGRWRQLADAGDLRTEGVPLECFRRSLAAIASVWGV